MSTLSEHLGELRIRCDLCVSGLRETMEVSRHATQRPPTEWIGIADKIKSAADCLRRSLVDLISHVGSCDKCPKYEMKRVEEAIGLMLSNADEAEALLRGHAS